MKVIRINIRQPARLAGLGVAAVLLVGGCSSSPNAARVDCSNAVHDLANARSALTDAQFKLDNVKKDTPDEAAAKAKVEVDKANVKRLASCPSPTASPTASPTTVTVAGPTVTVTAAAQTLTANQLANQLFGKDGIMPGMQDHVAIGSDHIDWKNRVEARGTAAFSKNTLKTNKAVANFINGSSDRSKGAKSNVVASIAKVDKTEVPRALDGSGYFPLQVKDAARILGSTYYKDGKVYEMGSWRTVNPNDVFWMFMTKKGVIVPGATIRADCGNPNLKLVQLITPNTPPAPPVECAENCTPVHYTPKCTAGQWFNGHVCLTPKDPSQDPQSKGNVPQQAVKHHPSPDNSDEVSRPAEPPVDSGNGIPTSSTPRVSPTSASPTPSTHVSGPSVPQPTSTPTASASIVTSSPTATASVTEPAP
jgi:hypothetical protein